MSYLSVSRMQCCGWREISSLSAYRGDFNKSLKSLVEDGTIRRNRICCGAFLFTGTGGGWNRYAKAFARDIKSNELGTVLQLPIFTNPNTRHRIISFMWQPDTNKLLEYCVKHDLFPRLPLNSFQ